MEVCVLVTLGFLKLAQLSLTLVMHHITHMGLQTEPVLPLKRCLPFSRGAIL